MLRPLQHSLASVAMPCASLAEGAKLPVPTIAETLTQERASVEVLGSRMSYLEAGSGEPVLFIHGNPTSSYLWRNVIPYVSDTHHAVAVDLIGMGASDKPAIAYTYADHYAHLAAFIEALDLNGITLVVHDWGAALGWDYARRNPGRVKRIAFMEGVLPPAFPIADIGQMGEAGQALVELRSEKGEEMVFGGNMFVEQMLPGFVNRNLGEEAMAAYRAPFLEPEDRRPTLAWPRALPIAGEPADTTAVIEAVAAFMAETEMPALAIYADPGVIGPPAAMEWYKVTIRNVETAYVGQGLHYIQEDQPDAIGRAIDDWLRRN
jgi:haloalkane dehalogenase